MSLESLMTQMATVTRYPDTDVDRYNMPGGGTPTSADYPVRLEVETGVYDPADRATVIQQRIAFFPAGADVRVTDLVVVDGVTYQVTEPPMSAGGAVREHHVEARLRYVSG